MPVTYDKIASTTLTSASPTFDFTGIIASYTDLVLVANLGATVSTNFIFLRFNNDSSSLYSNTVFYGSYSGSFPGTAIQGSGNYPNLGAFYTNVNSAPPVSVPNSSLTVNIQRYSSTSIFKSVLMEYNSGSKDEVNINSGVYRSTSAINQITLSIASGSFCVGSKVAIYGILAA